MNASELIEALQDHVGLDIRVLTEVGEIYDIEEVIRDNTANTTWLRVVEAE